MFHCFGHRTYLSKLKCFTRRTNVCMSQFHQHFTRKFFVQKCFAQLFSSIVLALQHFWRKNIPAKGLCKMLMKLTLELGNSYDNDLPSISSTINERIFHTNVGFGSFSTYVSALTNVREHIRTKNSRV